MASPTLAVLAFKTVCMLCIPAFFIRTSVSRILPYHLILTAFSNSLSGNDVLHDIGILSRYAYKMVGSTTTLGVKLSFFPSFLLSQPESIKFLIITSGVVGWLNFEFSKMGKNIRDGPLKLFTRS